MKTHIAKLSSVTSVLDENRASPSGLAEQMLWQFAEVHLPLLHIRGKTITNLCFADDIDGLAGEEEELAKLAECLNKASTAYGMEIIAEKTQLMTTPVASTQRSK